MAHYPSERRHRPMGNHNRSWIWGRHAVLETLRAGRWQPLEVAYVPGIEVSEEREIRRLTGITGIPVCEVSASKLTQLCRHEEHQGLAAKLPEFPYQSLENLLSMDSEHGAWVLLDRIQDSHNFGAILRSAEVFGLDGVIVGARHQAAVNSQVVRSSTGAVNYLSIAREDNLLAAAEFMQKRGYQIVAATAEGERSAEECDLTAPTVVVIGNEGDGVSSVLLDCCDQTVRIPQQGRIESLNAAVSAGILMYEISRQRRKKS